MRSLTALLWVVVFLSTPSILADTMDASDKRQSLDQKDWMDWIQEYEDTCKGWIESSDTQKRLAAYTFFSGSGMFIFEIQRALEKENDALLKAVAASCLIKSRLMMKMNIPESVISALPMWNSEEFTEIEEEIDMFPMLDAIQFAAIRTTASNRDIERIIRLGGLDGAYAEAQAETFSTAFVAHPDKFMTVLSAFPDQCQIEIAKMIYDFIELGYMENMDPNGIKEVLDAHKSDEYVPYAFTSGLYSLIEKGKE